MKMIAEVFPDTPWIVRTDCCGQKKTRAGVRVVPDHGIRFFEALESSRPGTLAEIGFRDPVPETLCGGCYEKLWGTWRIGGRKQRLMTKPDAMRLVWHEALPAAQLAKGQAWEQRKHTRRGRNVEMLTAGTEARAAADLPGDG